MEGRGVTNYSLDKPSYAFTSSTTEFDDALMKRGVVTHQQAIMAKGASAEEAQRLVHLKQTSIMMKKSSRNTNNNDIFGGSRSYNSDSNSDSDDVHDSDDDTDEDDEFLQRYRQKRLAELQQQQQQPSSNTKTTKHDEQRCYGSIIPIQRPEWTVHVNEASHHSFVVVILTSSHVELTGPTEVAATNLATNCPSVKFVAIPSTSAIAHFPDTNLPSWFVYKDGNMIYEGIGRKRIQITAWQLLQELEQEARVQFEPDERQQVLQQYGREGSSRASLSLLQRRQLLSEDEDDEDDDDEVL